MSSTCRSALVAAALAALCAPALAAAETQVEPIARLMVEGGWDSNVFYDGKSADERARISPDVGLKVHDHLYQVTGTYGGDWIRYRTLDSRGIWNQRGLLGFDATLSRRLDLHGLFKVSYAYDPVGLALAGVFRTGRQSALLVQGGGRAEYEATSRILVALALTERGVRFDDRTGGLMHAPSVDVLYRASRRLSVGGAYALSVFQDLSPTGTTWAFANGLRGRMRWLWTRTAELDVFAGPALWRRPGQVAIVPEAGAELRVGSRWFDLRTTVAHRLGIGSTASPGLVDSIEIGGVRRVGRRFELRGDAGVWRSGEPPTGKNANVGYALGGEVGMHVGAGATLGLAAGHLGRLDDRSAALRRTTVGIRLGWQLPVR